MLLVAPSARAGQIELTIDTALSSFGFYEEIRSPDLGPTYMSLPFQLGNYALTPGPWTNPSNVTTAWGKVYADYTPGSSLQLLSTSRVNYNTSGVSLPSRDNSGNIVADVPAATQWGFEITNPAYDAAVGNETPTVFGFANIHDVWQTFGTLNAGTGVTTAGGALLTAVGGNNYAALVAGANVPALLSMNGWQDVAGFVTAKQNLSTGAASSSPFPSPFPSNPPGNPLATFDGVTLTLPTNFTLTYDDDGTIYTIQTFGTLVAHVVVPEPSSMIMLGCGVVGLLSCGWRARKRRNLVA